MIDFFTKAEGNQIITAIQAAEKNTSGEIRVHLEADCKGEIVEAAQRTFFLLKMNKTAAQNGVLFFIAPERKEFAIIGDAGIDALVPNDFWDEIRDIVIQHFRQQEYAKGICAGVQQVGERLKTYFPYQSDDVNELPDDISYN
ncbi:MAG: TPM domain-containing protein [Bacteroidota bacterium]